MSVTLAPVGHLLGACSVPLSHRGETLALPGDVGRAHDLLMPPPQPLPAADLLLVDYPGPTGLERAGAAAARNRRV